MLMAIKMGHHSLAWFQNSDFHITDHTLPSLSSCVTSWYVVVKILD